MLIRKVLVVDDSLINRQILRKILGSDYEVFEAADGREALEILRRESESISAVLLDIIMPVMDGYELLEHMQREAALAKIPVIVATGNTDEESEIKALSLGAIEFIMKPYKPEVIKRRVWNMINLRETAAVANSARRDDLTGLYNRKTFFELAAEMIDEREPGYYVLSCLDIDNFKVINDQYGSAKGDEVLRFIADTFNRAVTPAGGICCRLAADNFAILYPSSFIESGRAAVIMTEAANFDGSILPLTISAGRYVVDDKSLSVSAMYDRAAIAESTVKGRFDVHVAQYDESMRERILREQEIVDEMNIALESGQFEVWLQPQYNHSSGVIIGAEALVRWRHPSKGMISPGVFIPVFERNGFIYELDKFVWERCCMLLRKWIDEGRSPLPVSVNISRYDIFRDDLVDVITGYIRKYGLSVELLRLEITESAFATSTGQIISVVKRLTECGFMLEIDDFGSGYSSLNTLKDVPADVLKLDMRFLEDRDDSRRGGNIIESVVRMAKWLGMSIIAEGVETKEQADFLRSIGCNYVQGYLYARPMPVSDYEALAEKVGGEEHLLALETVETLDNNAFWDPKSMETLIFNSYVGGACILEYYNGVMEPLRANAKYAQVLGGENMSVDEALKINWEEHMDEAGSKSVAAAVRRAIDTRSEVTDEAVFLNLGNGRERTYLRTSMRIIASSGDRHLFYCTIEDFTAQREAELKEREASEQLQSIMQNVNGGVSAITVDEDDTIHYIFTNDKYYSMLGYTREQYEAEVSDTFSVVHPDDRERIRAAVRGVLESGRSDVYEYRALGRDGSLIYLRGSASLTEIEGVSESVLLSVTTDITELAVAEHRLRVTDEQLQFLNDAAHDLLAHAEEESGIESVLKKVMEYFGGDRAFICEYSYGDDTCSNTYEVCAPGKTPCKDKFEKFPLETMRYWIEAFRTDRFIQIDNLLSLDVARAAESAVYEVLGAESVLAVSLKVGDEVIGAMGVFDPTRRLGDYENLAALGDYVAVTLSRRDLNAKINNDRENLHKLMNDTPGGFARLSVLPDSTLAVAYVNDNLLKMLGMDEDELMRVYGGDIMRGVHPDDADRVRGGITEALVSGERINSRHRLLNGAGEYIWVMVFGRLTENERGERFLNMYYTDPSEAEKRELSAREATPYVLQAIMRSTSELSFAKDSEFRYLCCSLPFARLVGCRDESEVVGKTDYELFTREIADKYRRDDERVMERGEAIVDMLERIPSDDGIPHYSSTSKYLLRDAAGRLIGLYGAGRDVTDYRSAVGQLKLVNDTIPGGLAQYELSEDGVRLLYISEGISRITGYSLEEYTALAEKDALCLIFEEDKAELLALAAKALREDIDIDCTYRLRAKDGCRKWFNLRGNVSDRSEGGAILNIVIFDVTGIKDAETELKRDRERMRQTNQLIDDSSSSVYVCDAQTYEMLYVNRRAAKMCGRTVEEARGMTCYKYLKGLEQPCESCYMDFATQDEYFEREYSSPASGKHYMIRGKFIDWNGRLALVEYMSDETERINARKGLHALIDGIPCGVGIHNYYPDGTIEAVYLNNGYYDILGIDRDEGQRFDSFSRIEAIHPDDRAALLAGVEEAVRDGTTISADIRVMVNDGYKWVNSKVKSVIRNEESALLYVAYADIDREKNAQLSLEASYRAMEVASANAGVSFWYYDMDSRTATHGDYTRSTLGLPDIMTDIPDSVRGTGRVHPEDEREYFAMYDRLFDGADSSESTVRLLNVNTGKYVWQHIVYTRLRDPRYGRGRAVGFAEDVGDKQEMKERYERELQLRREIVRDSTIYYELNLTTGIVEEFLSKDQDFPGMTAPMPIDDRLRGEILKNIVEEDREAVRSTVFSQALLEAYGRGETKASVVYRRRTSERGVRWLRANVSIMKRPGSGDIIAFLYSRDIDDERKAQLAIDSIIDEEIDSIYILNIRSGVSRVVKTDNDFFGEQGSEKSVGGVAASREIDRRIVEEDRQVCREFFKIETLIEALEKNSSVMLTYRVAGRNGDIQRKRTLAFYLDDTREDIVFSHRDITELYEEEQRQKQVLRDAVDFANEANRAKSEFLSRMSHDMRTPMNAILGMVNLAEDEENPPRTAEYLDRINASGKLLLGLINDILDLSRVESGEIELHEEPYTLEEFSRGIGAAVEPLMREKNINFIFDMSRGGETILVDKLRFNQIFFNLLSNAARYTPEGGTVEFTVERIPDSDGKYGMRYLVKDNGRGMSAEFMKVMFDPFSRESGDGGTETRGSGLGLAIVKNLVDAMGGSISATSEPGRGTEFTVDLYAAIADKDDAHGSEPVSLDGLSGLRVLLVEDNETNVLVARRILERKGCMVDVAKNGLEALEAYSESERGYYGVILMDVRMPVMDGLEATRRIRALEREDAAEIPIIAITADRRRTGDSGVTAHISKPIDPQLLYRTILKHIC